MAKKLSRLEQLPCPLCGGYLQRAKGRHGLVWLCRVCRAGAVTLPILRQVAPRAFVNQLWQAALHDGRDSRLVCPACTRPFTEFAGSRGAGNPQIKVCVRCFWVWFSPALLSSVGGPQKEPTPLDRAPQLISGPVARQPAAAAEARRVLGSLGARVLLGVIKTPPLD